MKQISVFIFLIMFVFSACSGPNDTLSEERTITSKKISSGKILADAFLYDTKIIRDGKPTSVRLYLFKTDSMIALSGKAYLGKGALKGWLTEDSVKIHFPRSNEFVYENLKLLFSSFDCSDVVPDVNVFRMFDTYPEALFDTTEVSMLSDTKGERYTIQTSGCDWFLKVRYDRSKGFPYLKSFEFDDGNNTVIKSNLRELKANRQVPKGRFDLQIPPSALQISL